MSDPGFGAVDLTNCDREPIHIPGSIQPHGALITIEPRLMRIIHAAGNTRHLLGLAVETLPGKLAAEVLSASQLQHLRDLCAADPEMPRPRHAFTIGASADPAGADKLMVDVLAFRSDDLLVLEFELRQEPDVEDALALVHSMLRQVQKAPTAQGFCEAVAAEVAEALGFDRVMVYRFMRDNTGAVIAESVRVGVDSFLSLHYPASDIPVQARTLYARNWIRHIPDARYVAAPILEVAGREKPAALDLSQASLRSVSPIHLQYLANMGVVSSMSMSIILGGRLWGLIACHHASPRYVPFRLRAACELFAEMASARLETRITAEAFEARLEATRIHETLVTRMSQDDDLADGLIHSRPNLLDFVPAGGVGLSFDGTITLLGATPTHAQTAALVQWLNAEKKDSVFHTDRLSQHYKPAEDYADVASGVLAISLSRSPRDHVLWFRPELVHTVTWGGNPDKPVEMTPQGPALTPRASFAAWQVSVRRQSRPWTDAEIDAAERLRLSLLEVVLRRIDQIAREREQARMQQERLLRELDARLEQWQASAKALKREARRRAVVEDELSQVLHRTVLDQEAERQRISRELHDTLGQSLTLMQLGLDGITKDPSAGEPVIARVQALKDVATELGRSVNRLAWEIRPTALDDLGLETVIRHLLESWSEQTHIQFDLQLMLNDRRLPPAIETTIYRVLQEALTNVVRHAEASRVGVILRAAEAQLTMIVEDDGRGFGRDTSRPGSVPSRRLGLLGMRERVSLVGGNVEVESAPGQGTTLFIRVPF